MIIIDRIAWGLNPLRGKSSVFRFTDLLALPGQNVIRFTQRASTYFPLLLKQAIQLILEKAKVAVCSDIRTKLKYTLWVERRIFDC
jgi:hypothetical protein